MRSWKFGLTSGAKGPFLLIRLRYGPEAPGPKPALRKFAGLKIRHYKGAQAEVCATKT